MKSIKLLCLCLLTALACEQRDALNQVVTSPTTPYLVPMNVTLVEDRIGQFTGKGGTRTYPIRFLHVAQGETQISIPMDSFSLRQFSHWDCVLVLQNNHVWSVVSKTNREVCKAIQR